MPQAYYHLIPLKTIHINKCPVLAPLNTLKPEDIKRLQLDLATVEHNFKIYQQNPKLCDTLIQVFAQQNYQEGDQDPDLMLYQGGFFSKADRQKMDHIPKLNAEQLVQAQQQLVFVYGQRQTVYLTSKSMCYADV